MQLWSKNYLAYHGIPGEKELEQGRQQQTVMKSNQMYVDVPEVDEHQAGVLGEDGTELEFARRTRAEVRNYRLRRADFAEHGFT